MWSRRRSDGIGSGGVGGSYAYRLDLRSATLLYPGRGERDEVVVGEYRIKTVGIDVSRRLTSRRPERL